MMLGKILSIGQSRKKTLKRILQLLKDIDRNGYDGIGKPEPLKGDLSGYWSRRIDDCNRIVYKIEKMATAIPPALDGWLRLTKRKFCFIIAVVGMVQPDFSPVELVGYEDDEAGNPLALDNG